MERVRIPGELPRSLIFVEPHPGEVVTKIGLHTQTACTVRPTPPSRWILYQSDASLDNVQTVHVYYDNDQLFPKGVLFTYNQGTEQAIGQCKIGLSKTITITAPDYLLYVKADGIVKLCFTADKAETEGDTPWTCANMAGVLKIQFDSDAIVDLTVEE